MRCDSVAEKEGADERSPRVNLKIQLGCGGRAS